MKEMVETPSTPKEGGGIARDKVFGEESGLECMVC